MEAFANFVIRHRKAILLLSVVVTVVSAALMTRLTIDTNFANYLSPTDPVIVRSKEVGNAFGANYTAMVLIESKDAFAPEVLNGISRLSKAYKQTEGVVSVISLTSIVDVKKTDSGLEVSDLIPNEAVLDDPTALAALRQYTLGKSTYANFLVSPDGRFTAIYVNLAENAAQDVAARALRKATDSLWPPESRPVKISYAGQPMIMNYLDHIVVRDMVVLVPLVVLLLVGILYYSFRTLRGVVLPLVAVLLATVVTFGLMGLTGAPLTLIAAIMPVVLISNGSAYGVHMLNFISLSYDQAHDSEGAVRVALRLVTVPILLSAVTTFIGFMSFVMGLLTVFESFGIYTAIGITAALVFALTFIPAAVCGLKPPKKGARAGEESGSTAAYLNRPLKALADGIYAHQRLALGLIVLIVLGLVPGIFMVKSDFDMLDFFQKDSEPRQADAVMTREFGGTLAYQIHLRGPVKDPVFMGETYRLHKHLRKAIGSPLVNSIADVIADMNASLNGQRVVPPTKGGVESLYLLMDGKSQLNQLVTPAADQALITGRLPNTSSAVIKQNVAAVDALVAQKLRPQLVPLPFDAVPGAKRPELAALVADELLDDLSADLAFAGRTLPDPAALRPALLAAVGQPAPVAALPQDERLKIIAGYLGAEDCDLVLEDQAQRDALAAALAGLDSPTVETLQVRIRETAPAVAEDAEGLKLASTALARLLTDEATRREHERLMGAIVAASAPAGAPSTTLASELRGELARLSAGYWPVTPARFTELAGKAPEAAAIVNIAGAQAGQPMVSTTILERVVDSQIYSLALCLVLVLLVMMVQLKSIRGGLLAMVPIVFTLAANFGLMGYAGITLNIVTALIASLAIGIGIDYTIHTAYRIRTEVAAGGSEREVLERTFMTTGRAVLVNALAVSAGFVVLVASELSPFKTFGGLTALSIAIAAVGSLTVYPVLILALDRRYITPAAPAPAPAAAPQSLPQQGETP